MLGATRLQMFCACDVAEDPLGPGLWRAAVQCAVDGRVRRGIRRLWPDPGADEHDAAAYRGALPGVRHCLPPSLSALLLAGARVADDRGSRRAGVAAGARTRSAASLAQLRDARMIRIEGLTQVARRDPHPGRGRSACRARAPSWRCLGRRGSGKTTLLRIIAGLDRAGFRRAVPGRAAGAGACAPGERGRRLRVPDLCLVRAYDRGAPTSPSVWMSGDPARAARRCGHRRTTAGAGPARGSGGRGCRRSSRAGSGSGWRWRAPWRSSRGFCCWTSRSGHWTAMCATSCAVSCAVSMTRLA